LYTNSHQYSIKKKIVRFIPALYRMMGIACESQEQDYEPLFLW